MSLYQAYFQKDEAALLLFDQHYLIEVNDAAQKLLPGAVQALIGQRFQAIFPQANGQDIARVQNLKLPDGRSMPVVLRYIWLTATQYVVRIRSPLLTESHLASEELIADTHQFRQLVQKLNDVSLQLAKCASVDDLYREIVLCGKRDLGFDRLGILLVDVETQEQVGTWGIDANGQLVDEHLWRGPLANTPWLEDAIRHPKVCHFWDEVDLLHWGKVVGRGWNAMANLWENDQVFGWLTADNLLTQTPLTPALQQIFRLYASSISQLSVRTRAEIALRQANDDLEIKIALKTQDLNDRLKELESMQKHLIEQEKHASLGNLVAGVAHEINTPLGNSLMSVSQLVYTTSALNKDFSLGSLTKTKLTSAIHEITDATALLESNFNRAVELVRSFKQLATHQNDDHVAFINLHDLIDNVFSSFVNQYKNRPLACFNEVDADLRFFCAPAKMTQIITNLLDNGLRHGFPPTVKHKGRIGFSAKLVGNRLQFSYADNGIGIDEPLLEKVFEPLRTSKRTRSTGLGLTIIYNIVTHDFGGTVHCERTLPSGLRLVMDFPVILNDASL